MNKLLEIKNLSYWIDSQSAENYCKKILTDINFEIFEGEILAIIGESGAGKTSLAKLIAHISNVSNGKIVNSADPDIPLYSDKIQLLFQNNEDLINPRRKVRDIVADGSVNDSEINKVLSDVGIHHELLDRMGNQLSGGERQRVALARLLITMPKLLILDEPFSAQDFSSKVIFKNLLFNLNKGNNLTLVLITHEINVLKNFADRIIVMYGGHIIEIADCPNFFSCPQHPYSKFLINSSNYKLKRKDIMQTDISELTVCNYYSRCERRRAECIDRLNILDTECSTVYCNFPYGYQS
jgi:peptide/nickel transport system ATP-binding protein